VFFGPLNFTIAPRRRRSAGHLPCGVHTRAPAVYHRRGELAFELPCGICFAGIAARLDREWAGESRCEGALQILCGPQRGNHTTLAVLAPAARVAP